MQCNEGCLARLGPLPCRMISLRRYTIPLLLLLLTTLLCADAGAVELRLPTSNHAIERGEEAEFYQGTARGGDEAWKGGRYGYVRNAKSIAKTTVYTRFHEGVDIRPLYRDGRGEPLDTVCAIAGGMVVFVNDRSGGSNYGRYVVIQHVWNGSPYYSLYAHLNRITVDVGTPVVAGSEIGRLGYTGAGINRARAHLHLEVGIMLNSNYADWHEAVYSKRDSLHAQPFNGKNLTGLNLPRLFEVMCADPATTMGEFLADEECIFTTTIPRNGGLDLLQRYPWMLVRNPTDADRSWRISFNESGLPLHIEPIPDALEAANGSIIPSVNYLTTTTIPYRYTSRGILQGSGNQCKLSTSGERLIELLCTSPNCASPLLQAKGDEGSEEGD